MNQMRFDVAPVCTSIQVENQQLMQTYMMAEEAFDCSVHLTMKS